MKRLTALVLSNSNLGLLAKKALKLFDGTIDFSKSIDFVEKASRYDTQQIRAQFDDCFLEDENVSVEIMITVTKKGRPVFSSD
jgi:hypothetical protein